VTASGRGRRPCGAGSSPSDPLTIVFETSADRAREPRGPRRDPGRRRPERHVVHALLPPREHDRHVGGEGRPGSCTGRQGHFGA